MTVVATPQWEQGPLEDSFMSLYQKDEKPMTVTTECVETRNIVRMSAARQLSAAYYSRDLTVSHAAPRSINRHLIGILSHPFYCFELEFWVSPDLYAIRGGRIR